MSDAASRPETPSSTRRDFLKSSTAAVVGGALAGQLALAPRVFAGGSDTLKLGLVGCGGRGGGAVVDALHADPHTQLVAAGDAFADKLEAKLADFQGSDVADRISVAPDKRFAGFDAYKQVIDSGIDAVILATPTHFRPAHLKYAIERGKHVFCEKPVAVDGPGIRSVFETCEAARKKGLSIVSGLCWRYDEGVREGFGQVHQGAVGDIINIQATYLTSTLKKFPRQPGWSDFEFQLRNWQHFTWLSGDFNVEQHVHSLDKVMWAMKDVPPVACVGVGGRQARTGPESGNVYDHFSVVYEFPGGVKAFCSCRQMDGCDSDVSDHIFGTKGTYHTMGYNITSGNSTLWKYAGKKRDLRTAYVDEHAALYSAIRSGTPVNNGDYMTKSTLMAIMGRMSAYTGKKITWEQALNSKEDMTPASYVMGPLPTPPVAVPGVTQFV